MSLAVHRRKLSNALALLAAARLLASPASAEELGASFEIFRKGEPIGTHVVSVRREGALTVVDTDIKMRVSFGPVPLFHYRHESREVWREGAVQTIDSRTNNNGRRVSMKARATGVGLQVDGTAFRGAVTSAAIPSSYWNKDIVNAPVLLNTQNGEPISISTTSLGLTAAPDGRQAEHFRVVGTVALDLWYDGARWVGSTFTVRGEELTYKPIPEPPRPTVEASLLDRIAAENRR